MAPTAPVRLAARLRALAVRASGPMTALGRTVVVVGVVAWVAGALTGWQELMIVAGACTVAVAVAALFTVGRTQLEVATTLVPARVVAGERAVAELVVRNTASRRMLPVRVETPVGRAVAAVDVPSLAAGEAFEEVVVIPTTRRSVVAVGPTRSVRGDPLGLMRREVVWTDAVELFVHPTTSPLTGVTSGWLRDLEGRPTNERSPSDVAFHTLREYVPGDDRRHIHWRTSARIGTFMVRQFIDNRRSHLAILVDTNPASYADADEFELAMSMAASLGLRAIADGQEATCVAGLAGVASHTGQALLDGLSRVELGVPTISVQELAMRATSLVTTASVVAFVTGSALGLADIQFAAQRFGHDAQTFCVRATRHERASLQRSPRLLSVSAESLDAFTRVMWAVGNS